MTITTKKGSNNKGEHIENWYAYSDQEEVNQIASYEVFIDEKGSWLNSIMVFPQYTGNKYSPKIVDQIILDLMKNYGTLFFSNEKKIKHTEEAIRYDTRQLNPEMISNIKRLILTDVISEEQYSSPFAN